MGIDLCKVELPRNQEEHIWTIPSRWPQIIAATFFIGSTLERLTFVHHWWSSLATLICLRFSMARLKRQAVRSEGLQVADLIARPMGMHYMYPDQPNRAFDTIERKLHRDCRGNYQGVGLKRFP